VKRERHEQPATTPIPLQKVKRPGADPFGQGTETPPGTPALHGATPPGAQRPGGANQPILLTKKKERKKTLPMDIGIVQRVPAGPAGRQPPAHKPSHVTSEMLAGAAADDDPLAGDDDDNWAAALTADDSYPDQTTTPARRKGS
jgi:hypothetical protein